MKVLLLACIIAVAAGRARAAAPLGVAQVYRDGLGQLGIDYAVGGWTFSENGRDLYVSGGDVGRVAGLMARLSLDPTSGALTFVDAVRDEFGPSVSFGGLGGATAFGPGEAELYYASLDTLAVFRREPISGSLLLLQSLSTSSRSTLFDAVTVTPDGRQVLATADDGIVAFARSGDGMLVEPSTPYSYVVRDAGDHGDVPRPGTFVVRADGHIVYALQNSAYPGNRNAVVVLARDDAGALTVVQRVADGFDDWVSLASFAPEALALSPDGRFLYAGDWFGDGGVVAFALDPSDGRVRHARVYGRGKRTTRVALSPDGGLLYTDGGGLSVWARDPATGAIEEVQDIQDGEDGAGLDGIERIVSSPDGRFVITLASLTHAITVFARRCGDGVVEADGAEACDDGNVASGDGCDAACRVETCFACAGAPSVCTPRDGSCDDGDSCTVNDACTGGRCAGTTAVDGTACDDGNACTTADACHAGTCVPAGRLACGACEVCDRETAACVGMVERGCVLPAEVQGGGKVPVYYRPAVGRFAPMKARSLRARISRDDAASAAQVGDPMNGTGYTVCLLDLNGLDDVYPQERQRRRVVVAARVPSENACDRATCWHRERTGALVYRGRHGLPDGVRKLTLGRTKTGGIDLTAIAGGRAFDLRGLKPAAGALTMQILSDTGACWQGDVNRPRRR